MTARRADRKERKASPAPRVPRTEVFVYGTLLSGCAKHRFLQGAKLRREAHTVNAFELYDLGQFPALVAGGTQAVRGEVYGVDEATLAILDRIEGHPTFYRRQVVQLRDGSEVLAYLLTRDEVRGHPVIASGSWREYVATRRTP